MALDCYAKWWWWCSLGPRRGGLRPMSSQPSAPCNRCLMVQSCVCYRLQCYHIDWCRCYSDHIGQSRSNTLVFAYLALRKSSFRSTGPTKITYFSARKRKMVSGEFQIFLLVMLVISRNTMSHAPTWVSIRAHLRTLPHRIWKQVLNITWVEWTLMVLLLQIIEYTQKISA